MVSFSRRATWAVASGQPTARPPTWGSSSRPSNPTVEPSAMPLEHSRPKLAGWAASPATCKPRRGAAEPETPQPTPQYGQVVRTGGLAAPDLTSVPQGHE